MAMTIGHEACRLQRSVAKATLTRIFHRAKLAKWLFEKEARVMETILGRKLICIGLVK